jgi:hypothetical protein
MAKTSASAHIQNERWFFRIGPPYIVRCGAALEAVNKRYH